MKYAIISDIHGNVIALEKALALISHENVEKIICLGDIIGIGTRSEECVELIKTVEHKLIAVRGNHEARFLFGVPEYIHNGEYKMQPDDIAQEHWIRDHLSESSREFLSKFEKEEVIELEGVKIAVTHYPCKDDENFEPFYSYPRKDELKQLFSKYDAQINLFGHTHIPLTRRDGDTWYINPGTLGVTDFRDYGTYGILTINKGSISYEEKSFQYNLKYVLEDFETMNPPKKNEFRDKFFGFKR